MNPRVAKPEAKIVVDTWNPVSSATITVAEHDDYLLKREKHEFPEWRGVIR